MNALARRPNLIIVIVLASPFVVSIIERILP